MYPQLLAVAVLFSWCAGCDGGRAAPTGDASTLVDGPAPDAGAAPDSRPPPRLVKLTSIFKSIHGAAVSDTGRIYVADSYGHQTLDHEVYWLDPPYQATPQPTGIKGSTTAGMLWDSGHLYVCDVGGGSIREYDSALTLVRTLKVPTPWNVQRRPDGTLLVVTYDGQVIQIDKAGATKVIVKNLVAPFDIVALPDGEGGGFWVSEQGPAALKGGGVRRFGLDGKLVTASSYKWVNPEGIARAHDGSIWVADTNSRRVVRVAPDGSAEIVFEELDLPVVLTPFQNSNDLLLVTAGKDRAALYRISP
jgi:DNA-binding beta-propeller fold protein YncE